MVEQYLSLSRIEIEKFKANCCKVADNWGNPCILKEVSVFALILAKKTGNSAYAILATQYLKMRSCSAKLAKYEVEEAKEAYEMADTFTDKLMAGDKDANDFGQSLIQSLEIRIF